MDRTLRILWRNFQVTPNEEAAAAFFGAHLRSTNFLSAIENEAVEEAGENYYTDGPPKVEHAFIGYDLDENRLVVITLVLFTSKLSPPPRPRFEDLLNHYSENNWQYTQYRREWDEYMSQSRGTLFIFGTTAEFNPDTNGYEYDVDEIYRLEPGTMDEVKAVLSNHGINIETLVPILSLLDLEEDFEHHLEELESEPQIIDGPCEDYPACGHDICPPRWSDGSQAAMVCTCGALLPPGRRWSLCDTCLGLRKGEADQYWGGYWGDDYPEHPDNYY